MRQVPIQASLFTKFPKFAQEMAIKQGAVPINDIFYDLWQDPSKIILLYGGFGSGKSVFIADKLIDHCIQDDYFRCFYGRKVYDTVRLSVFPTIVDRIDERGLSDYFRFSRADNSSMIIRCTLNKNILQPFGADNSDKLKSIKDPSHIFCEEFDQFSPDDFGVLMSRLRTEKVNTQFIGAFNTTKVKPSHWIKPYFFDAEKSPLTYPVMKRFCNYTDNYFLNQKEYEETLMLAAGFQDAKFREFAAGAWGVEEAGNTFIYSFRNRPFPDRLPSYSHVTSGMLPDYNKPLVLSFDFNVEPITCLVCQHEDKSTSGWVHILQEYRLMNSDIFELCARIATDHPNAYFLVTGDATGRNRSAITRGNKNYYWFIKKELRLNDSQFLLPSQNPSVANSRVLTNVILAKHPQFLINDSCPFLIADIENVQVNAEGGIDKGKDKHLSHLLDCFLYYNWNFHRNFLDKFNIQLPVGKTEPVELTKKIEEIISQSGKFMLLK